MRRIGCIWLLATLWIALGVGRVLDEPVFRYAHAPETGFLSMVELERRSAAEAAGAREAERWALTLALLLEFAFDAEDGAQKAFALDAALEGLVSADSGGLIRSLSAERRAALFASLARFDVDNPAGMRDVAWRLAQRRISVIDREVVRGDRPNPALDALLAEHGWTARGDAGPQGRQRAKDRPEYRTIDRHDVAAIDGMTRRHLLLPPTEALEDVPTAELERKLQRCRNFARRIEDLWTHQDGPRLHDFIVDAAMRDSTGVIRLVHAETPLLAQHDRMRRWRLREAMWRLGD